MNCDLPILKHNLHEAHFGSDEMENIAAVKEGKKAISLTCSQKPTGVCLISPCCTLNHFFSHSGSHSTALFRSMRNGLNRPIRNRASLKNLRRVSLSPSQLRRREKEAMTTKIHRTANAMNTLFLLNTRIRKTESFVFASSLNRRVRWSYHTPPYVTLAWIGSKARCVLFYGIASDPNVHPIHYKAKLYRYAYQSFLFVFDLRSHKKNFVCHSGPQCCNCSASSMPSVIFSRNLITK